MEQVEQFVARSKKPQAGLHDLLGLVHLNSGHAELAVPEFRRADELAPEPASRSGNLATSLHYTGKSDEAIALIDELIALQPDSAIIHLHKQ